MSAQSVDAPDHPALLVFENAHVPVDREPRTIRPFEVTRPYLVVFNERLYVVVDDTTRGRRVAHPVSAIL